MHEIIPGSEPVVIEDTAHLPDLERPAELNETLSRSLDSIPQKR
ncbi:alpha/beta fold hydrolase [Nonomuraea sp. NPDC051191]